MENLDKLEKDEIKMLENYLKEYRREHNIYMRILAVRMVKLGQTRTDVGKYIHKDRKTVGNWVKAYNEQGIDGLIPDYSKCGVKSKLSDEQLLELKNTIIDSNESYNIKDVKKLIELEFEVTYSYKQVWEIVRKKLGLNYRKPFIIYNEAPEDADDLLLKKTSMIDLENEKVVVLDESRCQSTTNTARQLCNSTINGKKDKNILKKTGERYGINGIGFQGINCQSAIFFNQKNNANNFVLTICQYLMLTIENPKAIKILNEIVNNPKLEIDNIKLELLEKNIDKKEFDEIFDHEQKIIPEKFKSKCKKYKINYYKINRIMKNHLQELLNNKELISIMEEEQILNIILDNARIHTAKIVEESCEILSVNLVFLPPYCPFLNPIEGVWKDIKREIYNENYYSLNELIELFETKFYEKVDVKIVTYQFGIVFSFLS